ncbi:MAG: permease [Candidatus Omnitrophica bacterium]|nr:permease [Candidatus Omnitrophota bacterium]
MNWIISLSLETWFLVKTMAPYLLFGFFIAGILHVLLPSTFYNQLIENSPRAVFKASLLGVPLPLCSCGVIPVATHLKKEGASNSATLSFLISTPTTGIDSILATWGLLGPVFALIRPLAAFLAGALAGLLTLLGEKDGLKKSPDEKRSVKSEQLLPWLQKSKEIFRYAFSDLVQEVGKWILAGLLIGGLIAALVPGELAEKFLANPWLAYPVMLFLGIPMYVCATGSLPIVAALIAKGMVPGAAMVFLLTGPATNTVTITFVASRLGKKSLFIYLTSIIFVSIISGLAIDALLINSGVDLPILHPHTEHNEVIRTVSGLVLLTVLVISLLRKPKRSMAAGQRFYVPDMHCQHCAVTIQKALKSLEGVDQVEVIFPEKMVVIQGKVDKKQLIQVLAEAGYKALPQNED